MKILIIIIQIWTHDLKQVLLHSYVINLRFYIILYYHYYYYDRVASVREVIADFLKQFANCK